MSLFTKPGLSHSPSIGGTGICIDQIDQGALLIGNGVDFDLNTLTAGPGVSIVNTAGVITISASGTYSYTLPIASATVLGGIKVGDNLSIDGSGVLSAGNSYVLPIATASILGGVKQGSNVTIDGTGVISVAAPYTLPTASVSVLGGIKVGSGLSISAGILSTTGGGTVTSVSLTAPSELNISGSPITGSGTIALTWAAETGNSVLASPSGGGSGTPGFRSLVAADIPNLDTAKITTGTLNLARLSGITTTQLSSTAGIVAGQIASIPNQNASIITAGLLATARGGTGVDSSAAGNGKLLIGTGSGLALANLTAGANITITNASGTITIASTGGGGSSSPLTTKGDIWGFTTVDARQPVGADGTFLAADSSQATGLAYKFPAGIAGVSTLSTALTSDVTMTSANVIYDAVSLSLTAGTWLLTGSALISTVLATADDPVALLRDGSGTVIASSQGYIKDSGRRSSLAVTAIVSPTVTTTYKLSAVADDAGDVIRAQTVNNPQGNTSTYLQAVQLTGAPASGPGALMPAVRCYNSGNLSVNNATWTSLTYNTNRFDQGTSTSQHSTSSNTSRLTCQQAGVYQITGMVMWGASATGVRALRITLNGSTDIARDDKMPVTTGGYVTEQTCTALFYLNVGDYVELYGYQESTGALNVSATVDVSPEFMMARIDSGPGAVQPNTKVQLDYVATTDIFSTTSVASSAWVDLIANQTFTVDDTNSVVEFMLGGNCIGRDTGQALGVGVRLNIDNGATTKMVSGGFTNAANTWINVLAGADVVDITGLSAGSHTVKAQVYFSGGSAAQLYCKIATEPNAYSFGLRVLERKQSSSPPSSTPAPAVRCYNDANISINNTTLTTLTFNTNRYDQGTSTSQHNTSSNTSRLVCQQSGVYDIGGIVQFSSVAGNTRQLRILLNGMTRIGFEVFISSPSQYSTTAQYYLNVGDYVELQVYHDAGSSINVVADSNDSPEFWMARIDSGGQGFVPIPMVKTSNYTILNSDCMVVAGANSLTFTLPLASSRAPGMPIVVKNDNFTGTSVARAGSDTVDGATSYSLDGGYNSVTLVGDGISVWRII